ncbi:MAG: antitoxin [Pseudonocardiaceae bacterium]|nr:antitoxin [Pseudonocardiaceae bacterium]
MNFEDIKNKAKQALGKHGDKAEGGVDKVGEHAKERFGHDEQVDSATDKAKGYINQDDQGNQGNQDNTGYPENR